MTGSGVLMVRSTGRRRCAQLRGDAPLGRLDVAVVAGSGDRTRCDGTAAGRRCCWRTGSTGHPALDQAIGSLGWRRLLGETVLWVGHASVVPHLDPRLRFEAVQPRSVDDHETLEREVFGVDPNRADARREELRDALVAGGLRAFVVRLDDEPIAVARLSQGDGVAGIYALGVAHAWRGKGYGRLLATIATRAGMATGNRVVWLSVEDGNAPARHVYDRLGFQPAFGWSRWLAPAD